MGKPVTQDHGDMNHWISRLAHRLADLYYSPSIGSAIDDRDADARRMRSELDAIRMHFPDHA
ncbi:hypothetical protein MCHUDSM44219_02026 [Mycolicibacterium chubuense]|uniref:Uncharacterized protein n=2 Tax=Mycolicibacterium chubuense TaxID=1800 RepID=A0A0J6Z8P4_MYCCU|nr:hypothetical protein MCHUDSM44219_02026 [Mycolicibacterium chubuense]SPY00876.1 Uncharacterised protein [Mycolicibacterium chubuense]